MRRVALLAAVVAAASCAPGGREPASEPELGLAQLLADADSAGYEQAMEPRALAFPRDHASHPRFRTEWWYFTGNLNDTAGAAYGFELTFFRFALTLKETAGGSAWRSRDAWMAHLAVTDVQDRRFLTAERLSRDGLGLAGSAAQPFRVWVEDFSAVGSGAEPFPLHLHAASPEASLDLALRATRPPVAHGEQGLDRKGPEPGNASYYYSVPRLAADGELEIGARRFDVSGRAWMDREWSSNALGDDLAGWDWLALELSDGRDLMVYRLRTHDGGSSPFSSGSLVLGDGSAVALSSRDVVLEPRDVWTSPSSGTRYPIVWTVSVPSAELELEVRAVIPNQELNLSVRYWEGAVSATGNARGSPVAGRGYLELTGY